MKILSRTALAAALILCLSAGAHAGFFKKSKVVFRKGSNTWVKIAEGNKKAQPFEHPHEFTAGQMADLLKTLHYFKPDSLSIGGKTGKDFELFTAEEIAILAQPLTEAFKQADSVQWVDFSINGFRGESFLGNFVQTDGVMFMKDGKLNVALRNIAVKTAAANDQQGLNTQDPITGYRDYRRLAAIEGQTAVEKNWVTMSPGLKPKEPPKEEVKEGEEPKPVDKRPAKERLQELQELYDQGLITEEEYNKKRQEILDDI